MIFKMLYSGKLHISSHLFLFFPLSHFSLNITNYIEKEKQNPAVVTCIIPFVSTLTN